MYLESDGEPETINVKREFAKPPAVRFPGRVMTLSVMALTATHTVQCTYFSCIIPLIC